MEVFTKAAEYMEIPVRRTDDEPLQKLFMSVRSELNLDLKNMKQEQAKFWKQHPAIVETAQLTRESAMLSPALQGDFRRRALQGRQHHEIFLTPFAFIHHYILLAVSSLGDLSWCLTRGDAVPLSARKSSGVSSEGIAPFLRLAHFSDTVVKKIARKKVKSFQEL
ncbi:hypothetical protein Bca52824_053483 [Brassica carinata]|uniref:Uncharacterized protein n=1 Tax=Brassica carinata TaxID=52824 RepID=A0A8X7R3Y3_BRACI|nr:hypothetical protein Bca52824_053483 [Brassica carinata]